MTVYMEVMSLIWIGEPGFRCRLSRHRFLVCCEGGEIIMNLDNRNGCLVSRDRETINQLRHREFSVFQNDSYSDA